MTSMKIIDVIPIAKGIFKEKLTYFSSQDIPLGSIVEVPIRKKITKALVVGIKDASQLKTQLRKADFTIKKIGALKTKTFLPTPFIESAIETARYFASNTGSVLEITVPRVAWENLDNKLNFDKTVNFIKNRHEKLALQTGEEERFATYRSLIRGEFAKKSSVLFIVPTLEDIKKTKEILNKGIESYTFCLNGSSKKDETLIIWQKILAEKHPVLVIATPQFMYLPRADFNVFILERENSSAYKQLTKPYIDMRTFAEILTKKLGIRLIVGDILLRTETVFRQKNLEFIELNQFKFRSVSNATQLLLTPDKTTAAGFSPIPKELARILEENINDEKTFVFGSRKGLHSLLSCNDCGHTIMCPNCNAPLVLHGTKFDRSLICNKCGKEEKVKDKCPNCGGWRIQGLGIGLELIEESLKEKFPDIKIFRLDKEKAKSAKEALAIISKFYETPKSILVGSELALHYLNKKIDNVAILSIDSLLSIPDFRINEKILSLILKLRTLSQKNFLIQTRHPDLNIWRYAIEGSFVEFFREEIEGRQMLGYPPFSVLIKITIQGQKKPVEKEATKLEETFKEYKPKVYPSFISKIKGKYLFNVLLRVPRLSWPDEVLLEKLASLSPKFMIKVDPENIL